MLQSSREKNVNECKLSESFACFDWKLENCACECCCELMQLVNDDYRAEPSSGYLKASPRDKHRASLLKPKRLECKQLIERTHLTSSSINILMTLAAASACYLWDGVKFRRGEKEMLESIDGWFLSAVESSLFGLLIITESKRKRTKKNDLVIQISN